MLGNVDTVSLVNSPGFEPQLVFSPLFSPYDSNNIGVLKRAIISIKLIKKKVIVKKEKKNKREQPL